MRAKKESLKANEVIVLGDFVENYQFLLQDEIQSYHWSKEYYTHLLYVLLTMMEICNTTLFGSSLMITSVQSFFIKYKQSLLVDYLKENLTILDKIFYFSDSCTGQYKNRKTLLICVIISKISVWMLNGYSLQLVMASHHAMVLGDLLNVTLKNVVYTTWPKFWATNQCMIYV